ncbi:hypothetical protein O1611_g6341 [Lasiodiplodia mahajangana]|uniref:Uncharacterized protein n=1 Tax=Lasiodiplodia mahajangana TaxID=1108764 RepID=A0ACC2JII1_9PEZI|nr:hypothetical protein O1611_g6341 [Lasiodiplodia mahajangana]
MPKRHATTSDLDAIVWIAIATSPADPVSPYRYPGMKQFPEVYAQNTRIRYGEYLADPDNITMVFEYPSHEDESVTKPVAFSIWALRPSQRPARTAVPAAQLAPDITPISTIQNGKPIDRRDASLVRIEAHRADLSVNKKRLFDDRYGDRQLYLKMLACHPDYQRLGAGTQLVEWGISKARAERLTITLFASPMGANLYRRLHFQDAGRFCTQVPGEDEVLESRAMVLTTM